MPEEISGQKVSGEPASNPSIQPPRQPPGNQGPPTLPTERGSGEHDDDSNKLKREIREGERLLIGIGFATILINLGIWHTYSSQLEQMRIATEASTRAANAASDSLELNQGNFDRMMVHTIHQTAAQIKSAESEEAAVKAADAARVAAEQQSREALQATIDNSHLDQRAWIGITDVETVGGKIDGRNFIFSDLTFTVRNFGRSPAIKLVVDCCLAVQQSMEERTIPDYDSEIAKRRAKLEGAMPAGAARDRIIDSFMTEGPTGHSPFEMALAPGDSFTAHVTGGEVYDNLEGAAPAGTKPKDPALWKEWFDSFKPKNLIFVGKISYFDIFQGTPMHTTSICFSREGWQHGGLLGVESYLYKGTLTFSQCRQGRMD